LRVPPMALGRVEAGDTDSTGATRERG
jgi:hypothetical protein